ncbi:MAG: hypothetical protein DCF17_12545 [Shackletoniella antarctica]|uniref:Uncharacterized protein n=1 Tax=Shackletoniella antarctica TaxID=268115 RepID=A0A2W4YAD6_9CYAN|nr:MAG: hypothetical protein DCF17_12545 [Shackletoniella antarctica]
MLELSLSLADELQQLCGGDLAAHVGAFEQAVGQVAFLLVQIDELLGRNGRQSECRKSRFWAAPIVEPALDFWASIIVSVTERPAVQGRD